MEHDEWENHQEESAQIHQGKDMLDQMDEFLQWNNQPDRPVYLDIGKAFDTIFLKIIIKKKLVIYELVSQTMV